MKHRPLALGELALAAHAAVAALAALAAVAALAPLPAQAQAQEHGYLCCNLRSDGAWLSDANYAEAGKTLVAFGTPLRVLGQGRYRVHVELDGKTQAIGNDYSRELPMDVFQRRWVVDQDPRPHVAALPPKLRRAIESARVTPGMTREQVAMALGWPIASETPHLDAAQWKYWLWTFSPFVVHFDGQGHVRRVSGDPDTLMRVYLP